MSDTTTAPAGRVYWFGSKDNPRGRFPVECLEWGRGRYLACEGKAPTWLRCHSSQADIFERFWPGAVTADDRVLKGTIMLGRED